MLHIHEDAGPQLARRAGASGRAPLKAKSASASAGTAPAAGKHVALAQPRRALGDITNKNGKLSAAAPERAGAGAAPKEAGSKPQPKRIPPPDFDEIERMFPAPPPNISIDTSGIDLDAIVDSVLKYERATSAFAPPPAPAMSAIDLAPPTAADVADALDGLFLDSELQPFELGPALLEPLATCTLDAAAGGAALLAGELPDSVELDAEGAAPASDSDDEMDFD
ncbi:hypothetical protein KFE25_000951 [Diacronema lutheri]|uniref:Uncharacterized protein n=1 Tax=Diacronema lutheri TaxID=2081491 RepID=A0A8J5XIV4_DIALT|nr:hypothetical protein KFE25_000951 [Diacronema lutheri]